MPEVSIAQNLLLPELQCLKMTWKTQSGSTWLWAEKKTAFEICPKCATASYCIYDRRMVHIKDSPIREWHLALKIRKRRFWCKACCKPFTEPVSGIRKGGRVTERYRRTLLWACETFSDLKSVMRYVHCSAGFLYKTLYAELERKRRTRLYPWPKTIGIDEHFFRHNKQFRTREFVSIIVDQSNKRVMELVEGRQAAQLEEALKNIPGRENVTGCTVDLCDPFKNFVHNFFPNAQVVADKFHVLRLLNPAINRRRKAITGDKRTLHVRRWLLRNGKSLEPHQRYWLNQWLDEHHELREIYHLKEALHGFYRIKGSQRAARALTAMTDRMAKSILPEVKTFRRTLLKWRNEILAYFGRRITNGRTEGFNNKAKLVKRRAYGYRSFKNYRLRLLNACA